MSLPTWMLLGFAAWTLLLLMTIGAYRWSRIVTRRARISSFRADPVEGPDWYRRAMRAHANCIENLPVFAAIVFALHVADVTSPLINALAVVVLVARVIQSLVHVCFAQTDMVASVRFAFFFVQVTGFLWLTGILLWTLL